MGEAWRSGANRGDCVHHRPCLHGPGAWRLYPAPPLLGKDPCFRKAWPVRPDLECPAIIISRLEEEEEEHGAEFRHNSGRSAVTDASGIILSWRPWIRTIATPSLESQTCKGVVLSHPLRLEMHHEMKSGHFMPG